MKTNELQVFEFQGDDIRVVEKDGEPWWVLKDLCAAFGEKDHKRVKQRLSDFEVGGADVPHPQNPNNTLNVTVVNESGMYSALFAMQPEKARNVPEEYIKARVEKLNKFKRWVTHEVLPSIRKHGAYITPQKTAEFIANPDLLIELCNELKKERERIALLEEKTDDLEVLYNTSMKFYTVAKFNKVYGRGWNMAQCQKIGKDMSFYCRSHAIEIRKCDTNDERFGTVNSYPLTAWESYLGGSQ